MLRQSAIVLVLVVFSSVANAQAVYRWVDAQGVTHYTDSPGSIPQGADVVATEGEPISEMGKPGALPRKVEPAPAPAAAAHAQPALEPAVPTNSEQYWRGQFRIAKDRIRVLEDEIAADRRLIEDPSGLPVSGPFNCFTGQYYGYVPGAYGSSVSIGPKGARVYVGPVPVHPSVQYAGSCISTVSPDYERTKVRLDQNQRALERAKEELSDLERRASFEAVPNEWRR